MMPPTVAPLPVEDTLALLEERLKTTGEDNFWVKVLSRRGMFHDTVASLRKATLSQIAKPEGWLPTLCGGGHYSLQVGHVSDDKTVGGPVLVQYPGEPKPVDGSIVGGPLWAGPREIIFPDPNVVIPRSSPWDRPAGATPRNGVPQPDDSRGGWEDARSERALAEMRRENERLRDAMDAERRKADEERHRMEIERERSEFARREAERESKFLTELRDLRAKVETTAVAPRSNIPEMLTALGPLLAPIIQGMNDTRVQAMKQQADAAVAQLKTMEIMLGRDRVDPMLLKLIERLETTIKESADNDGSAEMLNSMAQAFGAVNKIAMQAVQAAAEARLGGADGTETPTLKVVKEGLRTVENIFGAWGKSRTPGRSLPSKSTVTEPPDEITQVVDAMKALRDPDEVAAVIVKLAASDNPVFVAAMKEVNNNLNELAVRKLGTDWMMANAVYAKKLLDAVQALGVKEGVFRAQDADGAAANEPKEETDG